MTILYLLDTDVLSEPLRVAPDPALMRKLRLHENETAVPAPGWAEIRFGWLRLPPGRKRDRIGEYIAGYGDSVSPILPYDRAAAEWHAAERSRLERRGLPRPFVDGQIAAIAAVNELTLVTGNARDFKAFHGVRVVDWSRA